MHADRALKPLLEAKESHDWWKGAWGNRFANLMGDGEWYNMLTWPKHILKFSAWTAPKFALWDAPKFALWDHGVKALGGNDTEFNPVTWPANHVVKPLFTGEDQSLGKLNPVTWPASILGGTYNFFMAKGSMGQL
jgi:hypothetical protein